jgi:hypothetical protein
LYNQSEVEIDGSEEPSGDEQSEFAAEHHSKLLSDQSLLNPGVTQAANSQAYAQTLITTHVVRQGHGLMIETGTKIINLSELNRQVYSSEHRS